ncbi:MAG: tRNA threonylcarbamoyladenosine dehydratase [Oscillospiraceae bacterium]|nr:tRNA threonylcarbamoyladenosine dehydratase [Oscillospiraceae bacterium]
MNMYERTEKVIGAKALEKLQNSRIAVFGAGGVGGAAIEALVRVGIGTIDIFDGDEITQSNLNRQIIATTHTIGQRKVNAARERILSINPNCIVNAHDVFVTAENINEIDFSEYDYVIDAIDTVSSKIAIIENCKSPIISSMGTGNKLDPTRFMISDIYTTSVCPLAKVMRYELKRRNIEKLDVLWSEEQSLTVLPASPDLPARKAAIGSVSFVPPVAGMIIAGYVIRRLICTL